MTNISWCRTYISCDRLKRLYSSNRNSDILDIPVTREFLPDRRIISHWPHPPEQLAEWHLGLEKHTNTLYSVSKGLSFNGLKNTQVWFLSTNISTGAEIVGVWKTKRYLEDFTSKLNWSLDCVFLTSLSQKYTVKGLQSKCHLLCNLPQNKRLKYEDMKYDNIMKTASFSGNKTYGSTSYNLFSEHLRWHFQEDF